jgi:hypothetical protein
LSIWGLRLMLQPPRKPLRTPERDKRKVQIHRTEQGRVKGADAAPSL